MDRVTVDVGALTFDVAVHGPAEGRPVLLLHGFPQSSWSWRFVMAALADAGFRAVAPDQRGYSPGARPVGVEHYAMPHLVSDALGVLDALELERVDVIGHDWGAAIGWQLASRHADRVRSFTAVSVPHPLAFVQALRTDPDQRARSTYMKEFGVEGTAEQALLGDGPGSLQELFGGTPDSAPYLSLMREPGALTAALSWYRAQSLADVAGLEPVTVPTLYVWSDQDRALGEVAALATEQHVAGPYRFEVLRGISHWVPEEAPDDLSRLLLAHLAQH